MIVTPNKTQVGLPEDFDPANLAAAGAAGWENAGDIIAVHRTILEEGRANLSAKVTATLVRVSVNPAFSSDAKDDFIVPMCPGCGRLTTLVDSLDGDFYICGACGRHAEPGEVR